MRNGEILLDSGGNVLHAHGGHIIRAADGFYYWYGENRLGDCYVNCYRSANLKDWENRGCVLHINSECKAERFRANMSLTAKNGGKVNIERPKVVYNRTTGKYIMWMHFENGTDYSQACCAVASSDTPDGGFIYHGSFNPYGCMSRDCTVFVDGDDTAYFVSAARDNADLHIYRMQADYMNIEALVCRLFTNEYREAPALFHRGGLYYLLSSGCTGWSPNQGGWSRAEHIEGPWTPIKPLGDETTYRSQPAFVLTDGSGSGERYFYFGDRWGGSGWDFKNARQTFDYFKSSYYVSQLVFNGDDIYLPPSDSCEIDPES